MTGAPAETAHTGTVTRSAARYRFSDLAIAAVLLYLPCAQFPPFSHLRSAMGVPTWGAGNEGSWSISPFLVPETVLVLILGLRLIAARDGAIPGRGSGLRPLLVVGALTVAGGAVSLAASQYVGISIGGLAGRCTVLALAAVMALSAPSSSAVKLWAYAAIAGTAVMCAVGLFFFYQAFGIPGSLSSLPLYRVSPGIVNYQKATYGFASNTVDLLVLTIPTALALLVAKSTSIAGRILVGVAAVLMLLNLTISFERWGWVCVSASVLLIAAYYRRRWRGVAIFAVAGIAIVLVSGAVTAALGAYFSQAVDPNASSNLLGRVTTWSQGVAVLAANPGGVGLGMTGTIPALTQTSSHDLFLDIGIEGGILSLAGAVIWAAHHCGTAIRVLLRRRPADDWAFALLLGPLTFIAYGVFFNSLLYLSGLMVWLAFWWCFPIMAYAIQDRSEPAASVHVINRREALRGTATAPQTGY